MTVQEHIDQLMVAVSDPAARRCAEIVFEYDDDCFGPQIADRAVVKQVAADVVLVRVDVDYSS